MNTSQEADQGRQEELDKILHPSHGAQCDINTAWFAGQTIDRPCDCYVKELKAALNRLITSEAVRIAQESLTRVTENGHGGGNFRRLIILEEERLAELVKGEAENE